MSLGSTVPESSSSTWVDSAESGSQLEASLFWTSTSVAENVDITPAISSVVTTTIHLVTGPVNLPAICRCMGGTPSQGGDFGIRDFPDPTAVERETHRWARHLSGPLRCPGCVR